MRSVRRITTCSTILSALVFSIILTKNVQAQENSPYSRYGLGDVLPSYNIVARGMGGLASPYRDLQSVNFINPASYASLKVVTLDIGLDYTSRTLRTSEPPQKFKSQYLIPSYVQIGVPLTKKGHWGMNIGLRPMSRINYNLGTRTRLQGIDSVFYNYVGNGGSYQAYLGTGFGWKNFTVGLNAGYLFGNKEYTTRVQFINDTIPYKKTNSSDTTRFGGLFATAGLQWTIPVGKSMFVRLGLNGSLQHKLNATRDITRQTYENGVNGPVVIDSIYRASDVKGEIIYPASYGGGIILEKEDNWQIGVEYNTMKWSDYRYYGQEDKLKNSWTLRIGAQLTPDLLSKSYWSRVAYRVGFSYGPSYVDVGTQFDQYMFSFGAGFPLKRNYYNNQYTTIQTAFEYGVRGNKDQPLRENLMRITIGFNLSDIWFNKRKYD